MLYGKVLITGGAGTLGRAIIKAAEENDWDCDITIFSTDAVKHAQVRAVWPHVHSVIGDIRDGGSIYNAMAGMDIVIHAAAVKHIPVSEYNSIDTISINVDGSKNVCEAAMHLGTEHVVGISTDKSCHPANLYGATKMAMEKIFQECARYNNLKTQYHLVRYGNVLESTGSVIEVWQKAMERGEKIKITDPEMTRFFLSPKMAAKIATDSIIRTMSGNIMIPRLGALSIGKLAEYVCGEGVEYEHIPLRPGEKIHETLLTIDEIPYAISIGQEDYILFPTTSERMSKQEVFHEYISNLAPQLTKQELTEMLNDG